MKVIEAISDFLPNLIGGSADYSGSNNTKTTKTKIIILKILIVITSIMVSENMVWLP